MRAIGFVGSLARLGSFERGEFKKTRKTKSAVYELLFAPKKNLKGRYFKGLWHNYSMWIYPINAELDFGLITETKIIKIHIQNASRQKVEFSNFNLGNSGVEIKGIRAGEILNSSEFRELSFIALISGTSSFNEIATLIYEPNSQSLVIKGQRAAIFAHVPLFGYKESKSFNTDIFRAQNGSESRLNLLKTPARKISMSVQTLDLDSDAELLSFATNKGALVPLWFSASRIEKTTQGKRIFLDTSLREFKEGGFGLILKGKKYKFFMIMEIDANYILADKSLNAQRGDLVLPLIYCSLDSGSGESFFKGGIQALKLNWTELR